MAILTARSLDSILQEARAFLSEDQVRRMIGRLNAIGEDTLAAEWELIVLCALSYVGVVAHEPDKGGSTRPDFEFHEPGTGARILGDVRTVSDDKIVANSVDYLTSELQQRLAKHGIRGHTTVSVAVENVGKRGAVRPRLPDPHELRRYVFNRDFDAFVRTIIGNPVSTQILQINNERAEVSIQYSPGSWTSTVSYRDFRMPRDIERNVIQNALKRKHDQIRASGQARDAGWRCIVLCDGNCLALTGTKSWENHSSEEIITEYLAKHASLDLVVCVSIQDATHRRGELAFDVRAFNSPRSTSADSIRRLFKAGLDRLAAPVRTPPNARHYIERRSAAKVFIDGRQGTSCGTKEFSCSSRTLLDYMAGRIDRATFEMLVNAHMLDVLRSRLDGGALPIEIRLIRHEAEDDDVVSLRLGGPDPAVSPFRVR